MVRLRQGESWSGEFVLRRRDGTTFPGYVTDTGLYDEAGELIGIVGVSEDLSGRKDGESVLRRRLALGAAVEQVGASIARSRDIDDLAQRLTDAATNLTGAQYGAFFYNVIDADGDQYQLFTVSGVDRSAFEGFPMPRKTEIFAPTFEGREPVRLDDVTADPRYGKSAPHFGPPPGHLPVRSYLAVPVLSGGREALGGLFFAHAEVGVFGDTEEQVAVGLAGWAAIAFENAKAFAELQMASEEVAHLNRFKDQLLELVSHEFRTPVTTLAGLADFVVGRAGRVPEAELAEIADTMIEAADRLRELVENMLVVARLESGDNVRLEPVLIQRIIARVVEGKRRKHAHRSIFVVFEGELPAVDGNAELLGQMLENLLSNALKYSPSTEQVEVRGLQDNGSIEVVVRDGGNGMSENELTHAFDPFVRFSPNLPGAGLGLASCKRIIAAHGGTIHARNRPGGGLEVSFRLPVTQP